MEKLKNEFEEWKQSQELILREREGEIEQEKNRTENGTDPELVLIEGLELNEAEKRTCPGLEIVGRKKQQLMVKCNVCNDSRYRTKANAISHYITNHTMK